MIQNGVYVWEGRTCFLSTAHSDDDLRHVERAVRDSVRGMRARGMLGSKSVSTAAVAPQPTSQPEQLPATPGQTALRLLAAFSPQASAAYNPSLVFDFNRPPQSESSQTAPPAPT